NDFASLDQCAHNDAIGGAAVDFVDNHILCDIHQTSREITGVGGLQCRVGQSLTGAVRRNKVLQHRQSFAEVGGNRSFDDFTGRLRHQSSHTTQLADLL